ncbi:MAG: hypothetical protein KPEEDBHJ_03443 [Anaerolineales bacterium]|nr:hypothetical protein [Anaerolineales bacterium]
MSITLKPLEELRINGKSFVVQPDPDPDMSHRPYVELGGSGQVVQLSLAKTQEFHALKVFNNPDNSLINSTKKLEKNNVQSLPGLAAANRVVIDPKEEAYSTLLKKYPYLEYSVLMPWIGGYTWFEILGDKDGDKKIFNFSPKTSLYYAWQLAHVLGALEKKKYAHCDICSNNIILDLKTPSVQLIDIEDMYMPGGKKKEDFIGGQNGYAHPNRPLGHQWVQESDRFGGGLLISEILTWHDPEIRESSDSESFYLNSELCRKTKKYRLMKGVLERNGSIELSNLFEKVWSSNGLEDCPRLSEWESQLHLIVQNANVKSPEVGDLSGLGADGRIRIQRKRVSLTEGAEREKENIKSNRKKVDINTSRATNSQQSTQPLPSFQPQTDWGKVVAFILVAVLIIFICIALSGTAAGVYFWGNEPLPDNVPTLNYVSPVVVVASKTLRPTPTRLVSIKPTKTSATSDLAGYSCADKSKIKLRVGQEAIVPYYDVNLREAPIVPEVWDANIVVMLRQGDTMLVIGGPKCAHEGTWWEVKTDRGYTGWVRELQPNKILLEPLD